MIKLHALSVSVAMPVLAFGMAGAANAQTVDGTPTAPIGDTTATDATAPASVEDEAVGNGIIITAQGRNQSVQDVPIAVTAIGGDLVRNAGVQDVRQLQQVAPSLKSNTSESSIVGASLSIRGIGTAGNNPGFEPAVGVFIDGVFRARTGIALSELPPIERIEVLRGPQGTLFGRNTSAGALNVITAKPSLEGIGGFVEGMYGNYDAYEGRGMINLPAGDQLAFRVDGNYRKRDGYIRDVNTNQRYNDIDRYTVRAQGLFDNGPLTVRLIGDYSKTNEICCAAVRQVPGPLGPLITGLGRQLGLNNVPSRDPKDRQVAYTPGRTPIEKVEDYGFSGQLDYDLGNLALTSITAYRDFKGFRNQDIDFGPLDRAYREGYRNRFKDFTQELRVRGSAFNGALDFLVGGFYLNEDLTLTDTIRTGTQANQFVDGVFVGAAGFQFFGTFPGVPLFGQVLAAPGGPLAAAAAANPAFRALLNTPLPNVPAGAGQQGDNWRVKTNAYALFTHNIISFTDQLKLTLGARYNYEKKDVSADLNVINPACGFFSNPAFAPYNSITLAAVPGAFLLSCNPEINAEFNGRFSGDRDDKAVTGTAKLSYEPNRDLLFYGGYDRGFKSGGYNLARSGFRTALLGGPGPRIPDLAFKKETVNNYEIGVKWQVSPEFTINTTGFYSKFKDLQTLIFAGSNFVVFNIPKSTSKGVETEAYLTLSSTLGAQLGYSHIEVGADDSNNFAGTVLAGRQGQQALNQPKDIVTGAITWTPPITGSLTGLAHVDFRSSSEQAIGVSGTAADRQQGYILVNGRIGVTTINERIRVEGFVENLFDTYLRARQLRHPRAGRIRRRVPQSAALLRGAGALGVLMASWHKQILS